MLIETKYSLSHFVWVMHENKPTEYEVYSVEPIIKRLNNGTTSIYIGYRFEERGFLYHESDCFESKEALIQSL